MSIIEAIILGLVQGLTEFIPVSSSGHLLLAHELFGTSENTLGFDVALHVGTLAALLVFFRSDIYKLARNLFAKNADGRLARLLACATMPALIAGLWFTCRTCSMRSAYPWCVAVRCHDHNRPIFGLRPRASGPVFVLACHPYCRWFGAGATCQRCKRIFAGEHHYTTHRYAGRFQQRLASDLIYVARYCPGGSQSFCLLSSGARCCSACGYGVE